MLIKIENLWNLLSKKVNFDAQYWLHCTKKVKIQRRIGEKKLKVVRFAPNAFFYKIDQNPDS